MKNIKLSKANLNKIKLHNVDLDKIKCIMLMELT